jgi:hypothetical protein
MLHVSDHIHEFEETHAEKAPSFGESWLHGKLLNSWAEQFSRNPKLRAVDEERMDALRQGEAREGNPALMEEWLSGLKYELFEEAEKHDELGA